MTVMRLKYKRHSEINTVICHCKLAAVIDVIAPTIFGLKIDT